MKKIILLMKKPLYLFIAASYRYPLLTLGIFVHRIMVGLPSVENREKIFRTLLSKEKAENLDFQELAAMTEGYTGSDLKVFSRLNGLSTLWLSSLPFYKCNLHLHCSYRISVSLLHIGQFVS